MKALLIGCGQGGSRLTEAIMKIQCATFGIDETGHSVKKQFDALIINTTIADIKDIGLTFIPTDHQLIIGGGYSHTSGRGAGGDPRLGTQAARHSSIMIDAAIESVIKVINLNPQMNDIDAIIVISALGGGSGSGMGPVIAHLLKGKFGSQYPVIGIVTLPGEEEGQLNAYNASISINSWLKENNFDGIITIALGGKSLKPTDDSLQYFARFNKSVAKALYILFGGGTMGEGSKTVDVQDILTTIRDGGGICTLGHMTCYIADPVSTESQDCPLLSIDTRTDKIAGEEINKFLAKVEEFCSSHLFLPVNIETARAGLLVIKDSTKFKLTQRAGTAAANHVQKKISGPLRYSGLDHKNFPLITDNSNGPVFKDYEISEDDQAFSRNETVELALLLSGISDVRMIQDLQVVADRVSRFSRPPMGERLLAETLGLGIGEMIDEKRFLPCSAMRDNLEAQSQSKATNAVLERFITEIYEINRGLISEEKIKRGIRVVTVKSVPDTVVNCEKSLEVTSIQNSNVKTVDNRYEIELIFDNIIDGTHFKKKTQIQIKSIEEIEEKTKKKIIKWLPEIILETRGWTEKEQRVSQDVTNIARQHISAPVVAGIGDFPDAGKLVKKYVKRVRVIYNVDGSVKPVCTYYYCIDAHPEPVIYSEDQKKAIDESSEKKGYTEFWAIVLGKTDDYPSTEKIHRIFQTLGIDLIGGGGDE